ncbi:MAG: diadenylate cyclase [Paludibacteraceae bacterium]|nr:diadenylate cyclase [Paludibacteraceae bacterium]
MNPNLATLSQIKENLYLTDFLDILIIAVLIYSLFIFLRRTRTYMIFIGLAIAAGLYVISQIFNLYLTYLTLRYIVSVSVVIFVIVFQSEIRKYFEFLGLIGTRQIKVGVLASKSPSAVEIIQACVRMAQSKTGALIVIKGKDDLDNHIDGGVALDGVISEEVMLSIFNPRSYGHDGAIIIVNNRISKFAAQLPLSTNFKEIGKRGTRHSAALGISEQVDSLSIVVSEEKGRISVCRDGKLKTLKNYDDLEKEVNKFIKDSFTVKTDNKLQKFIKQDIKFKLVALIFAVVIWFFAAYQAGVVEKSYTIPVEITGLEKNMLVESYSPKEITVVLSGRGESLFFGVDASDFEIDLDFSKIKNGVNKQQITEKNIVVPSNLSLVSFEPDVFLLTAKEYYLTKIPIAARVQGKISDEFELKEISVTPELVDVWITKGEEAPAEITTEIIDVIDKKESVVVPVKIVIPEGVRLANGDAVVSVALTIEKRGE